MGRTLLRLQEVDPGFDPRNLLTFTLSLGGTPHDSARGAVLRSRRRAPSRRCRASPPSARSITCRSPVTPGTSVSSPRAAPNRAPARKPTATWRLVRSGYFATMRLPLRRGREFDGRDRAEGLPVCIVNETMARRHWPGQDPDRPPGRRRLERTAAGSRSSGSAPTRASRSGPAACRKRSTCRTRSTPSEFGSGELTFVVRTAGDPLDVASAVAARRVVGGCERAGLRAWPRWSG